MLFSAFLILCMTVIFILANYKNKFYYVFCIYFISISMLILTSSLYMAKISSYPYSFELDYNIFLALSKVRIPFMTLYRLHLMSLCAFMVTPLLFYRLLKSSGAWKIFLFLIPIVLFMLINDPDLSWNMYIMQNTFTGWQFHALNIFLTFQKIYNNLALIFYMIFPIFLLVRYYFSSMLKMKRQSALIFIICLSLIDLFIYQLLLNGYFYSINFNNVDLTKFPIEEITRRGYILTMLLSIGIVLIIFALTAIYKPFKNYTLLKKSDLIRNASILNNNLNSTLHTYKNAFLGINKLAEISLENLDASDLDGLRDALNMLIEISQRHTSTIHKSLNSLKDVTLHAKVIDITSCITAAASAFILGDEIQFRLNNNALSTVIVGDFDHLRETFINLFQNSINAIEKTDRQGIIEAVLRSEDKFLIIDFIDNGIGIEKKHLKNIFTPFYTTKPAMESGGLGLTYIEKVIKMHHGEIEVTSTENVGTQFRIILPLIFERNKR